MEVINVLVLSLLAMSWYGIVGVGIAVVVAIAFSNTEEAGWESVYLGLLFALIAIVLWGQVTLIDSVLFLLYYFAIGTVWSTFINIIVTVKRIKYDVKCGYAEQLSFYTDLISVSKSIRWVIYWPFSMIGYIIGDIIVDMLEILLNTLGGFRKRIITFFFNRIKLKYGLVDNKDEANN